MSSENAGRQMFAIFPFGGIYFAEKSDQRYHVDWFIQQGWIDRRGQEDPAFEKIFRGYIRDNEIHMYIGRKFEHWGCHQALKQFKNVFRDRAEELHLTTEAKVYFGFAKRVSAGTLAHYLMGR